jgi:DNA-binding XRE family transcriptional regulator
VTLRLGKPMASAGEVDLGIGGCSVWGDMIENLLNCLRPTVNRNSIKSDPMTSIRQVKAARAMLGWSQEDLAQQSGVSYPTIARLESVDGEVGGRADTADKIVSTLEKAGVIFVEENGEGPGVRLKKQRRK